MPTLEQIQYGLDRDSRRTWQRRSLIDSQDQQYNYDALSQVNAAARGSLNLNLTAISGVPAAAESWDYDPTGNWRGYHTSVNGTSTLDQHRVHDRGNRLTQIEDNPNNMILDRVGRMRQMAPDAEGDWDGKLELTWDAWSRITSVKNNGTVVGEYAYDGTHRRVTREVDSETLHSYYNDAWRPVEERKNTETTASMSYLWGARHRDDLVRRDRAVGGTTLNETRYVLMDYFNPAAITDATGTVKERYAFRAFGVRTILNPDFTVRSSSECGMGFGFQGQFLDLESGLMNYGYRCYAPYLGRWTCKDPIGEHEGGNLYAMLSNDAINRTDFLGLKKCKVASGPTYEVDKKNAIDNKGKVTPVESKGRKSVHFKFTAEFVDDQANDICCECCEVRQYIKWDKASGTPDHPGFGSLTPEAPYSANKFYEDRSSQHWRYGHREDMDSKDPNKMDQHNLYHGPGSSTAERNGCAYKGEDTPSRGSSQKGTWTFYVKVVDVCNSGKTVAVGDTIHIHW